MDFLALPNYRQRLFCFRGEYGWQGLYVDILPKMM